MINKTKTPIAITIVPPPPNRDGEEARSILAEAGVSVFQGFIRRFVAFQKAALAGCLVYDFLVFFLSTMQSVD